MNEGYITVGEWETCLEPGRKAGHFTYEMVNEMAVFGYSFYSDSKIFVPDSNTSSLFIVKQ